jgi:hypothetical protein
MGALEALNGWILFGLTTAFLFTVVQKAWLHNYAEKTRALGSDPVGSRALS